MNENQSERLVVAFERIADVAEKWYNARYPQPKERKQAVVTHVENDEDRLRKEQGASDETTEEWLAADLRGKHEREWDQKQGS